MNLEDFKFTEEELAEVLMEGTPMEGIKFIIPRGWSVEVDEF